MPQAITVKTLVNENRAFAGTGGVSHVCQQSGFWPGFLDRATGEIYLSRYADGRPARIHLLDGLPNELVVSRSSSGQVAAIKGSVVAGFVLDGVFYTRDQVSMMMD
jgi:hypothetical protein